MTKLGHGSYTDTTRGITVETWHEKHGDRWLVRTSATGGAPVTHYTMDRATSHEAIKKLREYKRIASRERCRAVGLN